MTWSQEISQLITDVDQLTSAANVKKSTLDASVASTEADKNAAIASAASATASFTSASTRSQEAEAHKNTALAIYGTNAAQQTSIASVQASAVLASGYAASGSAALQQDLSGIATTLHRSPNAITSMFIYDTSKDSDGGAWTEKCQNTSWYNETIHGKWLGRQDSEFNARYEGATRAAELVTLSTLSPTSAFTFANGVWTLTNSTTNSETISFGGLTTGKLYAITVTVQSLNSGSVSVRHPNSSTTFGLTISAPGTYTNYFVASGSVVWLRNSTVSQNAVVSAFSVREVTASNTQSGDYFQLTTDGKFYRLWKNKFSWTEAFDNASWAKSTSPAVSLTNQGNGVWRLQAPAGAWFLTQGRPESVTHSISFDVKSNGAGLDSFQFMLGGAFVGGDKLATNEWVRYSASGINSGSGNAGIVRNSTNSAIDILIRFPQLEIGSTVTPYEAKGTEVTTSEVFRGNKRDFPRLAAIVAESNNLTIYDLTEPGRPMWMRFIGTTGFLAWLSTAINISGVSAVNGYIVPISSSNMGGVILNFAKDDAILIWNGSYILRKRQLVDRNSSNSYSAEPGGFIIAGTTVTAIAMTVLQDAPTDPVTSLRVPTIAIATNSGMSIIKHNDTVVNSTNTYFDNITLSPSVLTGSRSFSNADHFIAFNPGSLAAGFVFVTSYGSQFDTLGSTSRMISRGRSQFFKSNSNRIGLRWLNESMEGIVGRHLSATIAPTYNTGWMHGDVRRAYLSDTDVGSVIGSELVINGGFDTDTSGWSVTAGAAIAGVSGEAELTGNGVHFPRISRAITTVIGRAYRITLSYRKGSYTGTVYLATGGDTQATAATGVITKVVVATSTSTDISVGMFAGAGTSNGTLYFDNISVREAVVDRTYRAQGASINGTLVKAQLASGTSLVGYSGWSAANYLREPYSADLDFGTGEFNTSAWLNIPVTLPLDTYPVIGSAVTATGWTNSGWDTFSTTGGSFTASKDITGGNDIALSTNTVSAILGTWYRVTITVSASTVVAYNVGLTSSTNSRSTQAATTGTGTKVLYIQANIASGNFTLAVISATLGSITVDSATIQEIGQTLVFDRNHTSGPRIRMGINGGGNITAEAFDGTTTRAVITTGVYNAAQWLKAEANYTTDGSLAIRVNGREAAVTRANPLLTLTNTSASLTVGNSFALDAPFPGSIALLKLGTTVPTAEQSIFMYEQEKQLFRANTVSVLPDTGSIVGMSYDDTTDRWSTVSAANESYWNGLVRNSVTPVPAGSYSRITTTSGVELAARITTNPGVDVTIPAYVLREELVKRSETASKLNRQTAIYDYIGGFTGNITTGSTAIAPVTNFTYPVSPVGARISGTGIPANTTIVAVVGTTIYISAAATATTTGLVISFLNFNLPVGFETESVTTAGVVKQEGATKDYTRLFDGFLETIRFAVAPGATTWVRIQASKSIQ